MLLLLPATVFGIVFLALTDYQRPAREAALAAFTVVAVVVLLMAELLSPFAAYSSGWVALGWLLVGLVLLAALHRRVVSGFARLRELFARRWDIEQWLTAAILAVFFAGTLASALLYPIINSDSLTYHMPRVFFWWQNHSVARFPTSEPRQLFSSPFAEYFILNLKALSGGSDRFANTTQWLSYVFSVVAVSIVARRLGASRRGQQVSAIAAAATPMAILQASTTQNDLTCALWSLTFIYVALAFISRPANRAPSWPAALWMGLALGLAVATKPTAYLLCASFVVWVVVAALTSAKRVRALGLLALALSVAIALNAGWYIDNVRLLGGDVLATSAPGNSHVLVKDRRPGSLATNALENISMMGATLSVRANQVIATGVRSIARSYGGNPDNPLTLEAADIPYELDSRISNHDVGPSPFTLLLVLLAAAATLWLTDRWKTPALYCLCAMTALVMTGALVSWNHYVNRVLLGSLLALVPLVGVAITALEKRGAKWWRGILLSVLLLSVMWGVAVMLFDATNRLVPQSALPVRIGNRDLGYWNTSYEDLRFRVLVPEYEQTFKLIANTIERGGFKSVGIDARATDVPLYPLLSLLSDRRLEYVGNTILPDKITGPVFTPEVVIDIWWGDRFDASKASADSGTILLGPLRQGGYVFVVRRGPA